MLDFVKCWNTALSYNIIALYFQLLRKRDSTWWIFLNLMRWLFFLSFPFLSNVNWEITPIAFFLTFYFVLGYSRLTMF